MPPGRKKILEDVQLIALKISRADLEKIDKIIKPMQRSAFIRKCTLEKLNELT